MAENETELLKIDPRSLLETSKRVYLKEVGEYYGGLHIEVGDKKQPPNKKEKVYYHTTIRLQVPEEKKKQAKKVLKQLDIQLLNQEAGTRYVAQDIIADLRRQERGAVIGVTEDEKALVRVQKGRVLTTDPRIAALLTVQDNTIWISQHPPNWLSDLGYEQIHDFPIYKLGDKTLEAWAGDAAYWAGMRGRKIAQFKSAVKSYYERGEEEGERPGLGEEEEGVPGTSMSVESEIRDFETAGLKISGSETLPGKAVFDAAGLPRGYWVALLAAAMELGRQTIVVEGRYVYDKKFYPRVMQRHRLVWVTRQLQKGAREKRPWRAIVHKGVKGWVAEKWVRIGADRVRVEQPFTPLWEMFKGEV